MSSDASAQNPSPGGTYFSGSEGLEAVATFEPADIVVNLTGGVGHPYACVRADVALANKEAIVVAGEIIAREAASRGTASSR